ncbi:MAG: decaprenyl-phosphate phosphoribosyltransferase [Fimbriimonadaceae bacterium]
MLLMSPRGLVRLARPHHWTKNLLVFAGLLFTGSFRDPASWAASATAFAAMCLISSAFYAWNDVRDADRDRAHPRKRSRPIPSGEVSIGQAVALAAALLVGGLVLAALLRPAAWALLAVYAAIQLAYNAGLKAVPVLDACAVGSGFVIRAALGAAAMGVAVSGWLLLCTGALALLVSFGKRRAEFHSLGDQRSDVRPSLSAYTKESLDGLVTLAASASVLCYGLYAIESHTARSHPGLFLTAPLVAYGVMRYLLLVFQGADGIGEPDLLLLRDRHLVATVALFCILAALAMVDVLPSLGFERLR